MGIYVDDSRKSYALTRLFANYAVYCDICVTYIRLYFLPKACRASLNASIGGLTKPAPIIPIPGSLCAIAVSMTGVIPVLKTLRKSIPVAVPAKFRIGSEKSVILCHSDFAHLFGISDGIFSRSTNAKRELQENLLTQRLQLLLFLLSHCLQYPDLHLEVHNLESIFLQSY